MNKLYKDGEETMPSSEEYAATLRAQGWSDEPPKTLPKEEVLPTEKGEALPADFPHRDRLIAAGVTTVEQANILFRGMTARMLDSVRDELRTMK